MRPVTFSTQVVPTQACGTHKLSAYITNTHRGCKVLGVFTIQMPTEKERVVLMYTKKYFEKKI